MSAIEIRQLTTVAEFREALELQREIWEFAEVELLPVRMFVVAAKIGGHVFGAFDGTRMIGFCIALPGIKPSGRTFLHSHMLGVRKEYRDRHVGRLLKLEQRREALSRGVDLVEWTFDPLELKNAFFNIERLGAIVRRYVHNQYGITASPLHGGLPTDRCVAEWWIGSPWVEATLAGEHPRPAVEVCVEVPIEIDVLRRTAPAEAREIQKGVGDRLVEAFDRGLAVIGFERSAQSGTYWLGRWDSK